MRDGPFPISVSEPGEADLVAVSLVFFFLLFCEDSHGREKTKKSADDHENQGDRQTQKNYLPPDETQEPSHDFVHAKSP